MQKHQDLQQTGAELQLTKMMKEDAATQEELDSNAGPKTNDNGGLGAALRLCGFSIGIGENAKDRQKGEGGRQ